MDLRYPFSCPDNSIDGIYSSHTLEHLNMAAAKKMLREVYRILKPGKYFRIIVPDLEKVISFYLQKNSDFQFETGCEAIHYLTQKWGHLSVWDNEFLTKILNQTGFTDIRKVEYGSGGKDKRLIKEKESRRHESLVIEMQKPTTK